MRIGLVGCGAVARKGHLPALRRMGNVELCAVADIDLDLAGKTAKRNGAKKCFADYRELLKEDCVDIVDICVPSHLHAQVAIDSANAGKHILVEKPMTVTAREAQSVLDAVSKNKVKLCVVQNYRYVPALREAKRTVLSGRLGRLVSIAGCTHTPIPLQWTDSTWLYGHGGALYDWGPHLVDAICWLADSRVKKVSAFGGDFLGNMKCINHVQVLMEFENKAVCSASVGWLTALSLQLDIHGTAGSAKVDFRFSNFLDYYGFLDPLQEAKNSLRKLFNSSREAVSSSLFQGAMGFYAELISDFVKSIEKNTKAPTTGEEALEVVTALEAAKLSLEENRVVNAKELQTT